MGRHGQHRLRHHGTRRRAVLLGTLGASVVAGLVATMMPLLAADDLALRAVADTTATTVPQDGDNAAKTTLATCPAPCEGNPRGRRDAVVRFAVSGVPAGAANVRATLRVHAWQASAATVTAHGSQVDAAAARPAPVTPQPVLDTVAGVRPGFNEWDVSALVTGNGTWTLSLAQTGLDTRLYWAATEHRDPELRPRLLLTYGMGVPPSPAVNPSRPPSSVTLGPSGSPGPCGIVSPILVPSCGAWWGMYAPAGPADGWDHGRAFAEVEAQVSRRFDIVHRYHDFSNAGSNGAFPDVYERQQMREGRLLFLAWESRIFATGTVLNWADVYSGRYDATIDAVAGRIRDAGAPVFLGFDHEPEDEPAKGTDAEFVRAWRHVHDRFAAVGADNAVWVWTVMGWSGHYDRYRGLYPGDRYVDWVAYDPYNFHLCNGSRVWKRPSTTVGRFYRWLDEQGLGAGKPRMLAEFGTNFDAADPTAKRRWFEEFPAALRAHPRIKAAVYFNSPGMTSISPTCDMTMNHDASALAGFARAGHDDYLRQPPPFGHGPATVTGR